MKMKISAALPALCLAASMLTGVAHATAFSVTAYTDPSGNVVDPSGLTYKAGTLAASRFTITGFNMFADGSTANPYTVGAFVSKSGSAGLSSTLAGDSLASTELIVTGTTYLTHGQTYTFTHDDGIVVGVDGSVVISKPSQVVATPDSFTYSGTSGYENFTVAYAENGAAPATLDGPFAATPEPSSIMLLGTGLMGVAGLVRRRLTR